ncbi:MAG: hypothetical protein JXB49_05880 [Bacteroidales bacterium]|nr:hypothetical protein [Bacteroidales bacterium]
MRRICKHKPKIFLDSGAFSAHILGKTIDIQDYIRFLKDKGDLFDTYANLDVISVNGYSGNRTTADKTLQNQKIMEKAGLHPLPVFHYGEPFEFLQYYLNNYDYICLGGQYDSRLRSWLNECFSKYICDSKGKPIVKVHAFGIFKTELLLTYPFYSSDATTWRVIGNNGSICVPRKKNGICVYDKNPYIIPVSTKNPKRFKTGKHIDTISYIDRKYVLNYLNEKGYVLGKSMFK